MSQRIHLDATPGLFHQVLHCHQGDVGRQFEIAVVTRDGYEIPSSGATFKIQAMKPSGLGFTVTGTAANNIISFTSTEDMTSEAGEIPTQLEIKSGNDVIYTSNFLLVCEKNTHPASVTDGSPEEIISEITLLVERAESAASTAGADAAAAAQARVDEMMDYLPSEVADLKSDLNNTYDVLSDSKPLQYYDKNTAPALNLFCLSGGGIYENVIYRCFLCEINGKSGEVYSFNYSGNTTSFEISQMRVAVINSIPAAGQNVTQVGVSDATKMRGQITLSQDSKYFCIFVQFSSSANAETYEPIIKDGLVVSKTDLFTGIYSDYKVDGSVRYEKNTDIYVGTNLLTGITPTLGAGWSGSIANGFTHASGNTEPLTIPISLGNTIYRYVLVMTDSDSRETAYTVSLGTSARIDPYNGTNSLLMGFVMNGSEGLVIRPASWYTGTLTNVALYRLGDELGTTKIEIEKNNIIGNDNADTLDVASKWNVALGYEAFDEAVCMSRNVALGKASLSAGRYGDRNVAVGSYTLGSMQSGNRNIAIGSDALYLATLVNDCTAVGKGSQVNGLNSEYNVSVGNYSLGSNDSHAIQNVAVGVWSGFYNGIGNTSVGHKSGYYTKGSNNVAVGRYAYQQPYITGNSNTIIGAEADCKDDSASSGNIVEISNAIALGYGVKVTESNQMKLGNSNNNDIYLGKYHLIFNDDHTVTWELV